jgi:hypothetical protein
MPDLPSTPQTSAIVESAAGTVDTAAGTAQATAAAAAAAPTPVPEPPSPPPAPVAEAAPPPPPAPKPAETVSAVTDTTTAAATPTPKASQVADTIDRATAAPTAKVHEVQDAIASSGSGTGGTVSKLADPAVNSTVGSVAKAADPVVNGTAGSVAKAADPVVNGTVGTVTQATDPVVKGTVGTVTQAADPVVKGTVGTVTQAADPVVSGAGAATGGAGSAVKQTVDTVTSTAAQATAPVRPVTDTVASATGAATAPVRPVVETVAAAPTAVARAAEPVVSGQGAPRATDLADAIAGPTGQATRQAVAAATGSGSSAVDHLPTHAGNGPRGTLADTLAAASGAPGVAVPPASDPGALAAPPAADPTTASLLTHTASAPTPGGAAHGTTADTLAQVATDPRLLVVTGVTALAGSAYVAARAAGCVAGGDGGVILNNVRLIPCLARTSMTAGGTAIAGFGSGVRQAAGSASRATRDELHVLGEHVSSAGDKARQDLADHVIEPFRDGIARATGDAPDGRGSSGSDLFFLGIGMVVGLLYAAILSLWLFLVRPRWSTRA